MKKIIPFLIIAIIVTTSCKKDTVATPSLIGFWKGKYSNDLTKYPTHPYAALFRNDGTVRFYGNSDTTTNQAEGSYTSTNSTIAGSYTYLGFGGNKYYFSATVNNKFTFLEGTYGSDVSVSYGSWFMSKQ